MEIMAFSNYCLNVLQMKLEALCLQYEINVLVKVKEKNLISRDKFRDPKDYGPHQSVI